MVEFFNKWKGFIVPAIAIVNTLIAGYLTLAIEHRPVQVPGIVLVLPEEGASAYIPEREGGSSGAGFLAVLLMGGTATGVAIHYSKKKPVVVVAAEVPVEVKGLPGVIGKIALGIAIRYLEVRAPKTPGDLDDNILELLIAIRDSSVLDLLKIKEAVVAIKSQGPENVEVVQ